LPQFYFSFSLKREPTSFVFALRRLASAIQSARNRIKHNCC